MDYISGDDFPIQQKTWEDVIITRGKIITEVLHTTPYIGPEFAFEHMPLGRISEKVNQNQFRFWATTYLK